MGQTVAGTLVPKDESSSMALSFPGTFVTWNFRPLPHWTEFSIQQKYWLLDCRKFAVDEIFKQVDTDQENFSGRSAIWQKIASGRSGIDHRSPFTEY